MCSCATSNFVGDTPYLNKMLNTADGSGMLRDNCDGSKTCNCNKTTTVLSGFTGHAGHGHTGHKGKNRKINHVDGAAPATTSNPSGTDWFNALVPIADSIFKVNPSGTAASSSPSSYTTNTSFAPTPAPSSSNALLYWSIGIVLVLVGVFVAIKIHKAKK